VLPQQLIALHLHSPFRLLVRLRHWHDDPSR